MPIIFKKLESNPHLFFDILPPDWQEEIVPFWDDYKNSSCIYIIENNDVIIGGGIVFSKCPPDLLYFEEEANAWFDQNYQYLGYIWIAEDMRNQNLGSFWLNKLKELNPKQNYWLLIEEEHLHRFYQKNDFILTQSIEHKESVEWLYTYKAPSL